MSTPETLTPETLTPETLTPETIVAFLASIFERRGADEYLGEAVTVAEHMLQGGPMSPGEAAAFESRQNVEAIIKVRRLDDESKVAGLETPQFQHFAPMLRRIVDAHCRSIGA